MKGFIKSITCCNGLIGVFEDDGETGYIYSYSPSERKIYWDLIIYQRESGSLEPVKDDIQLIFEKELKLLGVYVWNKLRGYVVVPNINRHRLRFSSPDDPGISNFVLPEQYSDFIHLSASDELHVDKNLFITDREHYWKDVAYALQK